LLISALLSFWFGFVLRFLLFRSMPTVHARFEALRCRALIYCLFASQYCNPVAGLGGLFLDEAEAVDGGKAGGETSTYITVQPTV
jgi:hypothetical protein